MSDPASKPKSSERLPTFHIQGLADLFHENTPDDDKRIKNFPAGSTLVITGAPGAGKTSLALSLTRSCILGDTAASEHAEPHPKHVVYYISTEVTRDRLREIYQSRGWFTDKDPLFKENPEPLNTSGLHVINPPLEIERPVKTSEELVNFIVRQIAIQPHLKPDQFAFVIIDSVTSLFKDSHTPGDERRQTHELIYRLKNQFAMGCGGTSKAGRLGMIILLSEDEAPGAPGPKSETYVGDIVFRLGLKMLPLGMRLRSLEVQKSQGCNLMMGMHTWQIITYETLPRLVEGKTLRENIEGKVKASEGLKDLNGCAWGTVIIAKRPYLQGTGKPKDPSKKHGRSGTNEDDGKQASGIEGLDAMLKDTPDYWFYPAHARNKPRVKSIHPRSVTIVVGEAGTGKTSMCYHWVVGHILENSAGKTNKSLLVGIENDLRYPLAHFGKKWGKEFEAAKDNCETIFRPRAGLHFNLLLMEIREWLRKHAAMPKRVAIDGISNLAATWPKEAVSLVLDALISLFSEYENCALLLTYEAAQTPNVLESDVFRLPADNIVMLALKGIEDARRVAVTIIKSSHARFDKRVREFVLDHVNPTRTHICSGFDAYAGLLSGQIGRASVTLQLFQENRRERLFNSALTKHLKKLLPYSFSLREFSRFDITGTLEGQGDQVKFPTGDVQIVLRDEWWVAHLVQQLQDCLRSPQHEPSKESVLDSHQMSNLAGIVQNNPDDPGPIFPGDFWCFEMEKATLPALGKSASGEEPQSHENNENGLYAVPALLDFGMFCVNRKLDPESLSWPQKEPFVEWEAADRLPWRRHDPGQLGSYARLLDEYLLPWCRPVGGTQGGKITFVPPSLADGTLVKLMHERDKKELPWGFAWDSRTPETAACFFYELTWAFGGTPDIFVNRKHNMLPVRRALSFVSHLVEQGLMPACPTLSDTSESAFSRHFYSTFTDVNERCQAASDDDSQLLMSLGFMPPGPSAWHGHDAEKLDEDVRKKKRDDRQERLDKHECPNLSLSPNRRDIEKLNKWANFRKRLRISDRWDAAITADHAVEPSRPDRFTNIRLRTGYGCCGAWMVGVKSPTGSPGLAHVLLQEIASLKVAKCRARMGAGMPARQDFYQHYGERPVPGISYLNWNQMLRFLASRARRRDRVYGDNGRIDPAHMHRVIHQALADIMMASRKKGADQSALIKSKAELLFKESKGAKNRDIQAG
ncbi:MAG: Circadian clock protein kinase KaiC [Prosthecobacter sp.]|nr:Circadian clock protein kinase KaiC [Prosthecobacter sp.]